MAIRVDFLLVLGADQVSQRAHCGASFELEVVKHHKK